MLHGLIVGEKGGDRRAEPRQRAHDGPGDGRPDERLEALHVFLQRDEAILGLGGKGDHLAGFLAAELLLKLDDDFRKGQHPDAHGDQGDTPLKRDDVEGQAGQSRDGLDAHCPDQHAKGGRDEAPEQGPGAQPRNDGHGHADECENFRRPHIEGHGRQRCGHEDEYQRREGVARH